MASSGGPCLLSDVKVMATQHLWGVSHRTWAVAVPHWFGGSRGLGRGINFTDVLLHNLDAVFMDVSLIMACDKCIYFLLYYQILHNFLT
jgi:hypothetical protein